VTRGWACRLQLLLALASAVIFGSKSRGTRDHILLPQIRDFPFLRLIRLARTAKENSASSSSCIVVFVYALPRKRVYRLFPNKVFWPYAKMSQYSGARRGHIEHLHHEELSGSLLPLSVRYFNFLLLTCSK
jgi:hypothetical protein